jgi:hypothetical protein
MKRMIFIFLLPASAAVNGQSPTPSGFNPVNPYQQPPREYPTPSRRALSQVPAQTRDAITNRNSSMLTSTPRPLPNNRTTSLGNSAPVPSGGLLFGNGAQMVRRGDQVIITDGGRRYLMSRKAAKPPPAFMMRYNCRGIKRWLDTHRVDDDWRWGSLWYMDHCL